MLGSAVGVGLVLAAVPTGDQGGAAGRPSPVAAMPAPLWRGVTRIMLACAGDLDPSWCDVIHQQARALSALPVDRAPARVGRSIADRGAVILAMSVEPDGDQRRLVAVARRAVEIDEAEGAARRAVPWDVAETARTDAVRQLLARILPYRSESDERLRSSPARRPADAEDHHREKNHG